MESGAYVPPPRPPLSSRSAWGFPFSSTSQRHADYANWSSEISRGGEWRVCTGAPVIKQGVVFRGPTAVLSDTGSCLVLVPGEGVKAHPARRGNKPALSGTNEV